MIAKQPGCHSNWVCDQSPLSYRTSIPNMNFIHLKTKELFIYPCGCHGNLATIAMTSVANSVCPKT